MLDEIELYSDGENSAAWFEVQFDVPPLGIHQSQ